MREPIKIDHDDPLLTVREVAAVLSVCTRTVKKWLGDGTLPSIKITAGTVRIPQSMLYRVLGERMRSTT